MSQEGEEPSCRRRVTGRTNRCQAGGNSCSFAQTIIFLIGIIYYFSFKDSMNNCTTNYSARLRSRTKQPVYTSDKRAKFAQRENKKWIRFVTVLGYIFFVSLPAVSLSVYYIYIWDPGYINKFPPEITNSSPPIHKMAILPARMERNTDPVVISSVATHPLQRETSNLQSVASNIPHRPDLAAILAEGTKSMESSAEVVRGSVGD